MVKMQNNYNTPGGIIKVSRCFAGKRTIEEEFYDILSHSLRNCIDLTEDRPADIMAAQNVCSSAQVIREENRL